MPPKASTNKIATAIAAANKTVVKNYNAANRAVNRAPAWVKWTIAAIAIAVIGYALWKVFFAGRKMEKFGTDAEYGTTWTRYQGMDLPNTHNFKDEEMKVPAEQPGVFPGWASIPGEVNAFVVDTRAGGTKTYYKYKVVSGITAVPPTPLDAADGVFLFVRKGIMIIPLAGAAGAVATGGATTTDAGRKMESTILEQITLKNLGSDFGPIQNVESSGKCQILASEKISEGVTGYVFDKSTNTCLLKRFTFSNMSADKGSEMNQSTTSGVFPYAINDWPPTHSPFMFKSIMDVTQFDKKDTATLLGEYNNFFETKLQSGSKFYLKTKDPINSIHYHYHTGPDKNEIIVAQDPPSNMDERFSYHYDDNGTYSHIKNSDNSGNQYLVSNSDGLNTWLEMSTDTTKPKDWVIVPVSGTKYYHIKNKNTMFGFEPEKGYVTYFGGLRGKDSEFGAGGLKISTTPYEWEIVYSS
jgi:hypothetical protein